MFRRTAAWRISIWPTLAFALGTGVAFAIIYVLVASTIRGRSDAWLSGEARVLADVSARTPKDRLYGRIVGEVAELATRELPDERNAAGQRMNSVFFLAQSTDASFSPVWVGPGSSDAFLKAISAASLGSTPQSIKVEGWSTPFRIAAHPLEGQHQIIYLGLSDTADIYLLHSVIRRFLLLWGATALLGFLISYSSARRTLRRVESITETVGRIDSQDLSERLPDSADRDEISRLAKTFNLMLDRIQSSVNQLRSVTDAVAHDLKSPVTSIRGHLESALCASPGENWRELVGQSIEDLDRLLNLLNTTLDLAEAEGGALRVDRSSVDLSELVAKLVDLYQPAMHERNLELTADLAPNVSIRADSFLLSRVVSNLLENELSHLPENSRALVTLRGLDRSAELIVEDTGPGFPPEIADRIFERFVKGKESPGHGLGLAFVEAVVKAHGGSIRIEPRPGTGARLAIFLPTHLSASASEPVDLPNQSATSAD